MYSCTLPSTSMLDGVGGQRNVPAALPRERPDTHCVGVWVDSRAGLDVYRNSHPPPGFYPRPVQPIASRKMSCINVNFSFNGSTTLVGQSLL
jgi:hypothetical protein